LAITVKSIAMTKLQKIAAATALTATIAAGLYEARQAAELRGQVQMLQQQQAPLAEQIQQLQAERDKAATTIAGLKEDLAENDENNLELLRLRGEMTIIKNQLAANHGYTELPPVATANSVTNSLAAQKGRELGQAVVRGEAGAFDKCLAEFKSENDSYRTNCIGLDGQARSKLAQQTFIPMAAAFKIIGDAAGQGNEYARDAMARAFLNEDMTPIVVSFLGSWAAAGDAGALDVLLHPDKYGVSPYLNISPLQGAADNGNQAAIAALAAFANDDNNQAVWWMTATSLKGAAAAGDAVSIDALINIAANSQGFTRDTAIHGLRTAAANQNSKAAQALGSLGL
jgi:hypothetical protein